jgi:hypothetical protein
MMNGVELSDDLPETMVAPLLKGGFSGQKLRDPEHESRWRDQCQKHMEECIRYLERNAFPKIS